MICFHSNSSNSVEHVKKNSFSHRVAETFPELVNAVSGFSRVCGLMWTAVLSLSQVSVYNWRAKASKSEVWRVLLHRDKNFWIIWFSLTFIHIQFVLLFTLPRCVFSVCIQYVVFQLRPALQHMPLTVLSLFRNTCPLHTTSLPPSLPLTHKHTHSGLLGVLFFF